MKLKIRITKEINLPDIIISNIKDLGDETLNKIMLEIKSQIQPYFNEEILIRKRYSNETCFCPFCNRMFNNRRALTTHISRQHPEQKLKSNLYLSAHKIETDINDFVYFMLENRDEEEWTNQTILKFRFPKS